MRILTLAIVCTAIPCLAQAQLSVVDPVIDFDNLPKRCPPWRNFGDECPRLVEHFGYEIYIAPDMVDMRDREFRDIREDFPTQWASREYYDADDAGRAVSKRFSMFLEAFDQIFVPSKGNEQWWGLYAPLFNWNVPAHYAAHGRTNYLQNLSAFRLHRIRKDDMLRFYVGVDFAGDQFLPCQHDGHSAAVYCATDTAMAVDLQAIRNHLDATELLVHEWAHAWHDLFIPNGWSNGCIEYAWNSALLSNPFARAAGDYWTTDPQEFFAEAAQSFYNVGFSSSLANNKNELQVRFPAAYDMIYYMMDWSSDVGYEIVDGLWCTQEGPL